MRDTRLMLVELSVVEQRYQAVLAVIRDGVPDNNWKEFTITVSDAQNPSANRVQRDCPRNGGGVFPA